MATFTISSFLDRQIPTIGTGGSASPAAVFTLNVFGLQGTITSMTVTLGGLSHTFPDDLDFLLVAPNGTNNLNIWSDIGGDGNISNVDLVISDTALAIPSDSGQLVSGTYRPTDYQAAETDAEYGSSTGGINRPGPSGGATLTSAFGGLAPNGIWSLYVRDDAGADTGYLERWHLTFTTSSNNAVVDGTGGDDHIIVAQAGINAGYYSLNGSTVAFGGVTSITLNGGGGNDRFIGSGLNETFIGGPGVDTVVYTQSLSAHSINWSGAFITLNSTQGGFDTTQGIERFQFTNGTVVRNDGNARVDDLLYYSRNLDVWSSQADADAHYNSFGWTEGRDPNPWFSTNGYRSANGDVKNANINPLEHYHTSGWQEGRDASASFDTELYRIFNPDIAAANVDPLEHFLAFGREEGRAAHAAVGRNIVNLFDANYYLLANPDIGLAGADPLAHYNQFGRFEGRDPNAYFDTSGYLAAYADVAISGVNPLEHYFQFGWQEGRDPSGAFDTDAYRAAYADVAAANVNPLEHFLKFGVYEGRSPFGDGMFD